jgi:hypothetical protein
MMTTMNENPLATLPKLTAADKIARRLSVPMANHSSSLPIDQVGSADSTFTLHTTMIKHVLDPNPQTSDNHSTLEVMNNSSHFPLTSPKYTSRLQEMISPVIKAVSIYLWGEFLPIQEQSSSPVSLLMPA